MPMTSSSPSTGNLFLGDVTDSDNLSAAAGKQVSSLLKEGNALSSQGMQSLGPVLKRLLGLLSGDEAIIGESIAPAARGIIAQYDTGRRAIAEFGGRGGGTASVLAESRFKEAGDLAALRFDATKDATGQLTSIAQLLLGAGGQKEQIGTQGLFNLLQYVTGKEAQTRETWASIGKIAGAAALTYFSGGAAAPLLASSIASASNSSRSSGQGDFLLGGANG